MYTVTPSNQRVFPLQMVKQAQSVPSAKKTQQNQPNYPRPKPPQPFTIKPMVNLGCL